MEPLAPSEPSATFIGALRGRSIVSSLDLTASETLSVIEAGLRLKAAGLKGEHPLRSQCLAMIFEKQSCRTRVTFETAMVQLGGHPIYLTQADIGLGTRETVPDIAKNLSRWVQGIIARTFAHGTVVQLAENASVPVINALSDLEHPCQALADFMTIVERAGTAKGFTLAWIGDGNNVCHSLMLTGVRLGARIQVATPAGYEPDPAVVGAAIAAGHETGGSVALFDDPAQAAAGAGAVYTDVWTSMGQEAERAQRLRDFTGFQVDRRLMDAAANGAFFLHCLPAHRGEEVSAEVIDGPDSAVFDEAENRLWVQKALLAMTMG